jgi:hypothetical protein
MSSEPPAKIKSQSEETIQGPAQQSLTDEQFLDPIPATETALPARTVHLPVPGGGFGPA